MKKLALVLICLFMAACGKFDLNLKISPNVTPTTPSTVLSPIMTSRRTPSASTPHLTIGQGLMTVRAYIDGRSHLILQDAAIRWHHFDRIAPGRWDSQNLPTIINGVEWYPVWPDSPHLDNQHCDCDSSSFPAPALPRLPQEVRLGIVNARGSIAIIQQPNAENDYALVVEFDDNTPGNAEWYEIHLSYVTTYAGFPDQTTTTGQQSQAGPLRLAGLQMTDARHGWAVSSSGRVLKTGDGASTWKDISPPSGSFEAHGLFAFDSETAWAAPTPTGSVWRTRDGGQTWQSASIPPGSLIGMQFPNARDGWLLSLAANDPQGHTVRLYKSGDGGTNWAQITSLGESGLQSYLPGAHTGMTFFDGQTGWLGGWWKQDNPHEWAVLKTTDGGAHWELDSVFRPDSDALTCNGNSLSGINPGTVAVDISCAPSSSYHRLLYLSETAGFPHWRSWDLPGELLSIYLLNDREAWMMANPGSTLNGIYHSIDGGNTWETINMVAWTQAHFDFISSEEGWGLVSDGILEALVHTTDGGASWEEIKLTILP